MKVLVIILSLFFTLFSHAKKQNETKSYLLDIRIAQFYNKAKKDEFEINLCLFVQDQILKSELDHVIIKCDFEQKLNPKEFDYHLNFNYLGEKVRFKAITKKTKSQIKDMEFSWDVENNPFAIGKMIHRFVQFKDENNLMKIEDFAFSAGLKMSQKISLDNNGNYKLKKSQKIISKEKAKKIFLEEDFRTLNGQYKKKNKQYIKTYLEVGGMLLAGGSFYQLLDFDVDKDFEYSWKGVKDKFSRGLRFDDNSRYYNFYAHPFVGAIYQVLARKQGLTIAEGYLLAFVSSAIWEYGPEFVEVASINDQFQTAFAGPVVGNVIFDLNTYLNSSGNVSAAKFFKYLFLAHDNEIQTSDELDQWGFNLNYWHKINIFAQAAKTLKSSNGEAEKSAGMFTLNIQLDTVKRLDEAGKVSRFLWDSLHSELDLNIGLDQELKHDLNILTKSVLFGLAKKNIFLDEHERKKGFSFILGASTAYEVKEGDIAGKFDKYALVNLLGPTLDIRFFIKGLKVRLVLDLYANFSSIRNFAIESYKQKHLNQIISATLENHKYYNGYGFSQNGKLEIFYKKLGLDTKWRANKTWSINGLDRNWDKITDQFDLKDQRTNVDVDLYYRDSKTGLKVGLGYEYKNAKSIILNSQITDEIFLAQDNEHIVFFRIGKSFF